MNDLKSQVYRGYTIDALVYAEAAPRYSGRSPSERRYHAAARVTALETPDTRVEKIATLFEFYGDARRAAQDLGRKLVDEALAAPAGVAGSIAPALLAEEARLPAAQA